MNSSAEIRTSPGREIRIFRDVDSLSRAAARLVVEFAAAAIRDRGRFTVALSGGSTPKKLYSLLATPDVSKEIAWENVHLFWGDERCVPPDDPESNYGMVQEVLLSKISIPLNNVHRIRGELRPDEAAAEYEALLGKFFGVTGRELPRFNLVLLGLGEDGHTASLFPESPALDDMQHLVVAPYIETLRAHRITLTLPVLNNAAVVAFLVAGEGKRTIVAEVLRSSEEAGLLPAQRIRPVNGRLLWFMDEKAAAELMGPGGRPPVIP